MYTVYFLEADRPLNKQYTLDSNQQLQKSSYPMVKDFTSIKEYYSSLEDLLPLLIKHGRLGHCLFKGQLTRDLVKESRAGLYHRDAGTTLLVFDVDGAPYATPDEFMAARGMADVSYILQWSASAGLELKPGLRCHIYVLLKDIVLPGISKLYLLNENFRDPVLRNSIELAASGVALRFKLDVTTMQNDKLIYIGIPSLGPGINDPHPNDRITLVKKTKDFAELPNVPNAELMQQTRDKMINTLRSNIGLDQRKAFKYKTSGTVEYLSKPGEATITGIKEERGFVYMNLNGGDSWAYYHPVDKPEFIYNFKGEPTYKTSELLPEYWRATMEQAKNIVPNSEDTVHLAVRNIDTSRYQAVVYGPPLANPLDENLEVDKPTSPGKEKEGEAAKVVDGEDLEYYGNIFKEEAQRLVASLPQAPKVLRIYKVNSERQLDHWMRENRRVLPDPIPSWFFRYNPKSSVVLDQDYKFVNTFEPSIYMTLGVDKKVTMPPPTINKLFTHVLGAENHPELLDYWYNWLAGVVQKRCATSTAWLFQGNQGTGKGLTMSVLSQMLGLENTVVKRMDELHSEFTGGFENKILVLVDEVHADTIAKNPQAMPKIKNLITEPRISVRPMYSDSYMVDNYLNFLFASNMYNPMEIPPDDRRFNIGNFQRKRFLPTEAELVQIAREIHQLYSYLMNRKVNGRWLRTPLDTPARRELIEKNMVSADMAGNALREGNLQFFWEQMPEKVTKPWESAKYTKDDEHRADYAKLVCDIVTNLPDRLTRDEIQTLFMGCTDKVPIHSTKFTRFAHHHGVHIKPQLWIHGRNQPGVEVKWKYDPQWAVQVRAEAAKMMDEKHLQSVKKSA